MKNIMTVFSQFVPSTDWERTFIFILFSYFISINTQAKENLYFEHLTQKNGLVQANLTVISRDHKGFVWMGSPDGLYKLDGVTLTLFQKDREDSTSISSNTILSLFQEPDSSAMWVGTAFGGINRFDFAEGTFKPYFPYYHNDNIKRYVTHINAITRLNENQLMIGTHSEGLFLVDFQKDSVVTTPVGPSTIEDGMQVFRLMRFHDRVLAGTSQGIYIFSNQGEVIYHTVGFEGPDGLENWFKDFTVLPSGKLLVATNNQIWTFDPDKQIPNLIKMPGHISDITRITPDNKNRLWIGTINNGLYRWDLTAHKLKHFSALENEDSRYGLIKNKINDLLFYGDQPIIMASTSGGLTSIDFNRLLFQYDDLQTLSKTGDHSAFFVLKDSKQRVWVWTTEGLFMRANAGKQFEKILDTDLNQNLNKVTGGWEAHEDLLYFSTSNGLLKYDLVKDVREWVFFEHPNLPFSNLNNLSSLQASSEGTLWLASYCGTIAYNPALKTYEVYPFPLKDWEANRIVTTDLKLTNNNRSCWIGSKGLFLIHLDIPSGKYKRFTTLPGEDNKNPLLGRFVLSMDVDSTDRLWLATLGGGLLYLNEKDSTLITWDSQNNFSQNTYSVLYGHDHHLWITNDYGIQRINIETDSLNEFSQKDGIYCEGFNERALFQTKEGEVLLGGKNGLVSFFPERIAINTYVPPTYISSYTVGTTNVLIGGVSMQDVESVNKRDIIIPSNKEVISFNVSVLNFSNSAGNQISWKHEGFDKKWSAASPKHTISYSNLTSGRYRLRVKGANNHGVWNQTGDYVDLILTAPFYQKNWFIWLVALSLTSLIIFGFWLRTRFLRRQKQLLGKLVEHRTQKLKQANHDLRKSQARVMAQKTELELHHNYLEDLVAERTSDLEKAKLKAEESDRLKTAFLANMSHEIRTPMNAIVGFSSLLALKDISEAERSDFVKMIQSSSESLLTLINDIIDISRIETGQMITQSNKIVLGEFLRAIIKSMTFEVDTTKEVDMILDIPPAMEQYTIYSDEHRLRQIIVNLMGNALKFTSSGYVKLGVRLGNDPEDAGFTSPFQKNETPDGAVLFFVEDTGIGIKKQDQQYIFDPFRKVEDTGATLYAGMGLGLSIVKNILSILGGKIVVKSSPGQGSVFYFFIVDLKA